MSRSLLTGFCVASLLTVASAWQPRVANADVFTADSKLTFVGNVAGQQRFRLDYVLLNTGEPLGLTAFRTFFNSDPLTQAPSGDRSTFVSYTAPDAWGDVYVFSKNAAGQWYVEWNYDFVSPPGPLAMGDSLTGFSVTFDWNDPTTLPPYQHAEVSNGGSHDGFAHVITLDNVTGTIDGNVTQACGASSTVAAGVEVRLLRDSAVFATALTDAAGHYAFAGIPVGTYTVLIIPPAGYATTVDNQVTSLLRIDQVASADFALTCQQGSIAGTVLGTCGGHGDCDDDHDCDEDDERNTNCSTTSSGLLGITVDLFSVGADDNDVLLAVVATDAAGHFSFPNVALGTYRIVIVTPLGYTANASSQLVTLVDAGATVNADFLLTCQRIESEPRTIGYWKHQVNSHLTCKGKPQESLTKMLAYTEQLLIHFNQNIVNPVLIYVPNSNVPGDRLRKLEQLFTLNKNATMLDRAKQQLLALLLNVVSGKISQLQVISSNGATVSQAITYANDLIQDGIKSNDELAKDIADRINNGEHIPGGWVPVSTRTITYNRGQIGGGAQASLQLAPAYPNPSRGGGVTIAFSLPAEGEASLELYDVNGRSVRTLASGEMGAGPHILTWDGLDGAGRMAGPGVYFYRLRSAQGSMVRSLTLTR